MTARVLTGSKKEIADQVARIDGEVREAIVFVEESAPEGNPPSGDPFAEMAPFTVREPDVDDSRDALYRPAEGE